MELSQEERTWAATGTQNLFRYTPSGTYYARFKAGGKAFRVSLETAVYTVAKLRLRDHLKNAQKQAKEMAAVRQGKLRVKDAAALLRRQVAESSHLKPGSKLFWEETLVALQKTWPGLFEMDVRKVTEEACQDWARCYSAQISPNRFNGAVTTLRRLFDIAIKKNACFSNPAQPIKRARLRSKQLKLPTLTQFKQFVHEIETAGGRDSKNCAQLVKFLAFTGCRKGEAAHVHWGDVDFTRNQIIVRGDPQTGTKNGEVRRIQVIPELRALLDQWREERASESLDTPLLRVKECQKAMDRAAALAGMNRITHHDLRHFFATVCIESGVDIPTVSRWLGHKDGGALAMRVYGHLRQEHSVSAAKRVNFGIH